MEKEELANEDEESNNVSDDEESDNEHEKKTKVPPKKKVTFSMSKDPMPTMKKLSSDTHEKGLAFVFGTILTLGAIFTRLF